MDISNDIVVVKRSGQRVDFNGSKIAVAIKNAYEDVSDNYDVKQINKVYESVLKYINDNYQTRRTINVEEIQDIIENSLNKINPEVYEAFVQYRNHRAESRKVFSLKQQHKFVKVVERVGNISDLESPQNSLLYNGKTISREYTKSYVLDSKFTRSHEEGRTFIYNLPYFPIGYLNDTHIDIDSTLNQNLLKLLMDVKTEVNGEVSIDDIDIKLNSFAISNYNDILKDTLSKYLKVSGLYEYINIKKLNDRIDKNENLNISTQNYEEFILNSNIKNIFESALKDSYDSLTRYLENYIENLLVSLNSVIAINNKYSISISESENLIRSIIINKISKLDTLENVTLIYKVRNNYDIDTIYKLIGKNIHLVFNNNNYFSNGLLIADSYGKSNISYVSINIARIAMRHKNLNPSFYKELDDLIELSKNELLFIFETIGDKLKESYNVLFKNNMYGDEKLETGQKIRKVIKSGTLNINLVGLKESAHIIDPNNTFKIINKIVDYINEKINFISSETKLNFTLSSVVDESCYKLIKLDSAIFGLINDVTNKDKYLNVAEIKELEDIKELSLIEKKLSGGNLIELRLKNISEKKLREVLDTSIKYNVGTLKLRCD